MSVNMIKFTNENLYKILDILTQEVALLNENDILEFTTTNDNLKAWVDLSQILQCKILMPQSLDNGTISIKFQKLNTKQSFHREQGDNKIEAKYGIDSTFAKIQKLEEPAFLHYYLEALKNATINKRLRILNLGVNSGDEFEVIKKYAGNFENLELVGIDYCQSAIDKATEKFKDDKNVSFYACDINDLESLKLEKFTKESKAFDLIITIGTLQSTSLNFKLIFQTIVQKYLKKDGAIILGFPNCRWIDGEMIYGAKAPNYSFSEMSILYNDVIFCKKYLQQKKFRVTITGKDYIFLTATSIRK
ncbi:MAG: methyltransferase domain-containing protein [Arcobacteraceae bacterium]|nr:methyltransferase domain-containing protein [Arcobacteraceae bacterium]